MVGRCIVELIIKGELNVDDVVGRVNGVTGKMSDGVFPHPGAVFEFPDCTDVDGVWVPPLLAECTQDDKIFKNSCG